MHGHLLISCILCSFSFNLSIQLSNINGKLNVYFFLSAAAKVLGPEFIGTVCLQHASDEHTRTHKPIIAKKS